jgi:hypothetical protein
MHHAVSIAVVSSVLTAATVIVRRERNEMQIKSAFITAVLVKN